MPGLLLIMAVAWCSPPDQVETLVRQLGANRYAEREAASLALENLGPASLPALRKARDHADLEIRSRARRLCETIEKSALVQATKVRLDFKQAPLERILTEITSRSGQRVTMLPDLDGGAAERSLTLVHPEPLDFWKAMDRLCDTAGLQVAAATPVPPGQLDATLSLQPRTLRPRPPLWDSGPFRVRLMGFHYQHDLSYDDAPFTGGLPQAPNSNRPAEPTEFQQFFVRLNVAAEPRLIVTPNGPLRLLEARDDRGRSLIPVEDAEVAGRPAVSLSSNASSTLEVRTNLARPGGPSGVLKRLRGTIPVQVGSRRSDPLTLPLSTPDAKARNEEAALRLVAVRPQTFNNQRTIELAVALPHRDSADVDPFAPRAGVEPFHFEIVDAKNQSIPWYLSSSTFDGDEARLILTTLPGGRTGPAETLRYYATTRTTAEIPFEFRDVRIP